MSDQEKELLRLAAKAAGLQFDDGRAIDPKHYIARPIGSSSHEDWDLWNPLIRDRDAFRLMAALLMTVSTGPVEVSVSTIKTTLAGKSFAKYAIENQLDVLRRLIVECAAEHGCL